MQLNQKAKARREQGLFAAEGRKMFLEAPEEWVSQVFVSESFSQHGELMAQVEKYPYEIVKKEDLYSRPPRIPYNNSRIRYRHYGKTLEKMIQKATEFEPGVEKDQLIKLLATQMKKSFLTWNKESVDDRKIFKDLDELSEGQIILDEEVHKLAESRDILARNNTNNKKNYSRKGR